MPEQRAVLDSVIQSSTIEVFQAYGIAVAPIPRFSTVPKDKDLEDYLAGLTTFAGRGFNGTLTLLLPQETLSLARHDITRPASSLDWTRELTNQLIGRIKNRLMQFQVSAQSGLPTAMSGPSLPRRGNRAAPFAVYGFRTLRREVVVTLTGAVDYSIFVYSGMVSTANEGDIILF